MFEDEDTDVVEGGMWEAEVVALVKSRVVVTTRQVLDTLRMDGYVGDRREIADWLTMVRLSPPCYAAQQIVGVLLG